MKLLAILLSLAFVTPAFCVESNDKTDPLVLAVTSSNWSWENSDGGKRSVEDIQFYRGGFAQNPKFFTARWEVIGARTLVLNNTNYGTAKAGTKTFIVFDAGFTHFVGFDFNGKTIVEGFRRESVDPNRLPQGGEQSAALPGKSQLPGAGAVQASPVGLWHWFIGPDVAIKEDGTADLDTGHGHWTWTDKERREFRITWDTSKFVDNLTLSPDGLRISGKNNQGVSVTGDRIKGSAAP